jgi:hypothetical protein
VTGGEIAPNATNITDGGITLPNVTNETGTMMEPIWLPIYNTEEFTP